MMPDEMDQIITRQLAEAQSIVVVSHIRPDGDAIGSLLALGQALRLTGKQVQCVLQDPAGDKYAHLPGAEQIQDHISAAYDYLIVVDCSDRERTGKVLAGRPAPNLVIDHHITHVRFGAIDLVEGQTEATALILARRMPLWNLPIDAGIASALLTGIVADTLGFRTANVTPAALRSSADLMEKGADLAYNYHQALLTRRASELRFWGQALNRIALEDGLLWTALTVNDRMISGYPGNDDADLINILSSVADAQIAMIFVEQENGSVKVSWRAIEGLDVSRIAFEFGGGGHAAAAGADIPGSLQDVQERVLKATRLLLDNHRN